jgi:phosphoglycolate phosphatase
MQDELLFDAVLFDLDGTLVATDRFWVQAARTGARRAFEELGIADEPPSAEDWMGIVGLPPESGFRSLFPDLAPHELGRIRASCEEEERRLIEAGGAAVMPGALEVLRELTDAGVRVGVASNCSAAYLVSMLSGLGLDRFVEHALCIESEGVRNKADMLARLLERFGTRSAVMVGDRIGDRDAAWENGLPHVHCSFGFAPAGEVVEAEARIEDLGELPRLLERRAAWIEDALERGGAFAGEAPFVLGITGESGAGRSLFARDAARLLRASGLAVETLDTERFRRPASSVPSTIEEWYDLDGLEERLGELRAPPSEAEGPVDVVLLEGPFLLDPRLQSRLDRVIHLEVSEPVRWRRIAGRDRSLGTESLLRFRTDVWRLEQEHRSRYAPGRLADLVLEAETPFGPVG